MTTPVTARAQGDLSGKGDVSGKYGKGDVSGKGSGSVTQVSHMTAMEHGYRHSGMLKNTSSAALSLSGFRGTPVHYSHVLEGLPVGSSGSDHVPSYSANYAAYQSDHYGQNSARVGGRGTDTTPDQDEGYFWTDQDRETCVGGINTGCHDRGKGGHSAITAGTLSGNNSANMLVAKFDQAVASSNT